MINLTYISIMQYLQVVSQITLKVSLNRSYRDSSLIHHPLNLRTHVIWAMAWNLVPLTFIYLVALATHYSNISEFQITVITRTLGSKKRSLTSRDHVFCASVIRFRNLLYSAIVPIHQR